MADEFEKLILRAGHDTCGAFIAALLVGLVDTMGRTFVPDLLHAFLSESASSSLGRALSSMMIYLVMALVLIVRPEGLFPATSK